MYILSCDQDPNVYAELQARTYIGALNAGLCLLSHRVETQAKRDYVLVNTRDDDVVAKLTATALTQAKYQALEVLGYRILEKTDRE